MCRMFLLALVRSGGRAQMSRRRARQLTRHHLWSMKRLYRGLNRSSCDDDYRRQTAMVGSRVHIVIPSLIHLPQKSAKMRRGLGRKRLAALNPFDRQGGLSGSPNQFSSKGDADSTIQQMNNSWGQRVHVCNTVVYSGQQLCSRRG